MGTLNPVPVDYPMTALCCTESSEALQREVRSEYIL